MPKKRSKKGFIYIISNSAFPNYYKIGITTNIKSRLRTYQTSSPYRNYKIEYYVEHEDCYNAEQLIHSDMERFATRWRKEWFECSNLQIIKDHLDMSRFPDENPVFLKNKDYL